MVWDRIRFEIGFAMQFKAKMEAFGTRRAPMIIEKSGISESPPETNKADLIASAPLWVAWVAMLVFVWRVGNLFENRRSNKWQGGACGPLNIIKRKTDGPTGP